jgi:hypothetical protein
MFSARGYFPDTATTDYGIGDGQLLLKDWYSLTRDMAKRAIKYKHLPVSLSDTDMLIYIMNVYHYVIANLSTLLNLNRLLQWNIGFSVLGINLPQYMSRITRLWRRASCIQMPDFLKAHAIQNGYPVYAPGVLAPTFRFWTSANLLAYGSGGPNLTSLSVSVATLLNSATNMGTFVTNLETCVRWLETGSSAIATDFIAVQDLINMSCDIVPGAFRAGLPRPEDMPGLTSDPRVLTDILRRAALRKDVVTAGTDQWCWFPTATQTAFGNRIPVVGFGPAGVYDVMLLGAPKFAYLFGFPSDNYTDVDAAMVIPATDIQVQNTIGGVAADWKYVFGHTAGGEGLAYAPAGTQAQIATAFDVDVAATIRTFTKSDSIAGLHPWDATRYASRSTFGVDDWSRLVNEKLYGHIHWMEVNDFGENWAEFLGRALGVPYMKATGYSGGPQV